MCFLIVLCLLAGAPPPAQSHGGGGMLSGLGGMVAQGELGDQLILAVRY